MNYKYIFSLILFFCIIIYLKFLQNINVHSVPQLLFVFKLVRDVIYVSFLDDTVKNELLYQFHDMHPNVIIEKDLNYYFVSYIQLGLSFFFDILHIEHYNKIGFVISLESIERIYNHYLEFKDICIKKESSEFASIIIQLYITNQLDMNYIYILLNNIPREYEHYESSFRIISFMLFKNEY